MTLRDTLSYGKKMLDEAGIATIDAWYLLEYICKFDRSYFLLHHLEEMDEEKCSKRLTIENLRTDLLFYQLFRHSITNWLFCQHLICGRLFYILSGKVLSVPEICAIIYYYFLLPEVLL